MMDTISYSAFRNQLASAIDQVNEDKKPLLVTRQNGKPAVVMSLDEFHSYEETAYLMASPRNAARLAEAMAQIDAGKTVEQSLIEP
jgi:antitoxin YefM